MDCETDIRNNQNNVFIFISNLSYLKLTRLTITSI